MNKKENNKYFLVYNRQFADIIAGATKQKYYVFPNIHNKNEKVYSFIRTNNVESAFIALNMYKQELERNESR